MLDPFCKQVDKDEVTYMTRKAISIIKKEHRANCTAVLLMTILLSLLMSCSDKGPDRQSTTDVGEQWGIEITRLHLTANGYMVDFRYRVLDSEKARELFVRKNKPYLIDQKSGKVLAVPNIGKVGPLRTSNMPKEGKIYWMFFENISGLIQSGSKVTVVIGDFRAENLVVL
jgi:hypothetical protein